MYDILELTGIECGIGYQGKFLFITREGVNSQAPIITIWIKFNPSMDK